MIQNHKADIASATDRFYDYSTFSKLTGRLSWASKTYRVQYRRLTSTKDTFKALSLVLANMSGIIAFLLWLFQPSHINVAGFSIWLKVSLISILVSIMMVEIMRLVHVATLCLATLTAKEPIPVVPQAGTRVAFTTTIVPSKEPFEVVRKTLLAMKRVRHEGVLDVWLLDEGNDPQVARACRAIGVKHFSRKGKKKWNTEAGSFKAKTKHGNHNAWLDAHGSSYDFVLSVDSDHIPVPSFARRLLGYFRDPDVGFVVSPQVYGNFDNTVTRGAESQSSIFQATIQRAGNTYHSAMFVGTNHAYRVAAWETIGGFQDSITEDMLTGMAVHSTINPATGNFWESVYSPDVVAVGEGPSSWTDFFSQQLRWARGANEVLLKNFFPMLRRLPWRSKIYYSMLISYYPTVAMSWFLGIVASIFYLVFGKTGVDASGMAWLAFYVDVVAVQTLLYAWLRKYNVSPHEERGTIGFPGMFLSALAAPIYATALADTILRRKASFVVTPKGDSASADNWSTFSKHFFWAGLVTISLIYSVLTGHYYSGVKLWSMLTLAVCLAPAVLWQASIWPETKQRLEMRAMIMQRIINQVLMERLIWKPFLKRDESVI
jgi:cellulose synthase/poly-beta-1,6-N-acetylglucosamine synthase-like glycosyltransferase